MEVNAKPRCQGLSHRPTNRRCDLICHPAQELVLPQTRAKWRQDRTMGSTTWSHQQVHEISEMFCFTAYPPELTRLYLPALPRTLQALSCKPRHPTFARSCYAFHKKTIYVLFLHISYVSDVWVFKRKLWDNEAPERPSAKAFHSLKTPCFTTSHWP